MPSSTLEHSTVQPIALVCDVSPSMDKAGNPAFAAPIHDLNRAVEGFLDDVATVTHCQVEIMVVSFDETIVVECDFTPASELNLPSLVTRGAGTNLLGALSRATEEVRTRCDYLRQTGIQVKQPWLVCVTDGQPNVNTAPGFESVLIDLIQRCRLLFYPVAVGGYGSYDALEGLSPRQKPIVVPGDGTGISFKEFFEFLSKSVALGQVPNPAALGPGRD